MNEIVERVHRVKGSPREVGFALGRKLGSRLENNIDRYIQIGPMQYGNLDVNRLRDGALSWLRALPQRFQDEFDGMAEGANTSLQRLAEWSFVDAFVDSGCTGIIYLLNSQAWVARNNDVWAPECWGYATIREVEGRIPTISFGLEGDVFTGTGINQRRLWLHSNYLPFRDSPTPMKSHLATYVWLTEALETCGTISDVERLLNEVHRDGGMILFAIDGSTNELAVFECSCSDYFKREFSGNWIAGANHYSTVDDNYDSDDLRIRSKLRLKRVETLIDELRTRGNSIDAYLELKRILADSKVEARRQDYCTASANIVCPSYGKIWYTFGGYPAASAGNWRTLEWPW